MKRMLLVDDIRRIVKLIEGEERWKDVSKTIYSKPDDNVVAGVLISRGLCNNHK